MRMLVSDWKNGSWGFGTLAIQCELRTVPNIGTGDFCADVLMCLHVGLSCTFLF